MPNKTEEVSQQSARWSRRGGGRRLERITVNLTPRSSSALDLAVELTGDTKTDTINRAIQIYAYLEKVIGLSIAVPRKECRKAPILSACESSGSSFSPRTGHHTSGSAPAEGTGAGRRMRKTYTSFSRRETHEP